MRRHLRAVTAGICFSLALALLSCAGPDPSGGRAPEDAPPVSATTRPPAAYESGPASRARVRTPQSGVTVLAGHDPRELTLEVSRALFASAPTVVVAPSDGHAARHAAADAARALNAPLLLGDAGAARASGVRDELNRLGARTVLAVGVEEGAVAGGEYGAVDRKVVRTRPGDARTATARLDPNDVPAGGGPIALSRRPGRYSAAAATVAAAGGDVRVVRGDPRAERPSAVLSKQPHRRVLVLGRSFGSPAEAAYKVRTARPGHPLPGGGHLLFPGRRMVALYGHPGTSSLGALGEQGVGKAVHRARRVARPYARMSDRPVVPAFELIATVASGGKGRDGDFSNETAVGDLERWVDAAHEAGMYVVLDLQPGRSDFLTQAKRYERLLRRPYVGLGLDPEWRLGRHERPLSRVGSVDVREVNAVAGWLAALTRRKRLPQKLLVLHQFRTQMIRRRSRLDTGHPELAVLIHADGQGTQGEKRGTWRRLHEHAPEGVHWGWKNFLDEDHPTLSPRKTYAVRPRPDFVSYQ